MHNAESIILTNGCLQRGTAEHWFPDTANVRFHRATVDRCASSTNVLYALPINSLWGGNWKEQSRIVVQCFKSHACSDYMQLNKHRNICWDIYGFLLWNCKLSMNCRIMGQEKEKGRERKKKSVCLYRKSYLKLWKLFSNLWNFYIDV